MGSQICYKRGRNPQECHIFWKASHLSQRVYRDLQPGGEGTEGASEQRPGGLLKAEKGGVRAGCPEAGRGRPII